MLGTADARSALLPSEQFPGPWQEVTQEIRDLLALNKVSACSQAAGRESSAAPAIICCTAHQTRRSGQAGASNQRRRRFAAPTSFTRASHRRMDTKSKVSGVAESNPNCTRSTLGIGPKCPLWAKGADGRRSGLAQGCHSRRYDLRSRFVSRLLIAHSVNKPCCRGQKWECSAD